MRGFLAGGGFGILTEFDVAATPEETLGSTRDRHRVLGACNPQLAAEALEHEVDIGLLRCVTVDQDGGDTVVSALDPATMVDLTDDPALADVAGQAAAAWKG